MNRAPSLFVSHGSPLFAVQPGRLGPLLRELGGQLHDLHAVLVVSPHWSTRGVRVMSTVRPETLHDFGGFPQALYQLQYPAAGAPSFATKASHLLSAAGFDPARNIGMKT